MNIGRLLSGLIILTIGVLVLLNNFGIIESFNFYDLLKYWPIILVIIGLSILFKLLPKPLEAILNILLALGIAVGLTYVVINAINSQASPSATSPSSKQIAEPVNEDAKRAKIEVNAGAADISIEGGSTLLVEGTVENIFGSTSIFRQYDQSQGVDEIKINQFSRNWFNNLGRSSKNIWNLSINQEIETDLLVSSGASKLDIDLSDTNVKNLEIDAGASTINIDADSSFAELASTIKAGASTINLRVPKDTGLEIELNAALTTNNFEKQGLLKNDKIYRNDGFENFSKKVRLAIDAGASTVNLELY